MENTNPQPSFDTMTEAITWLQANGYKHDFNLDNDCIRYSDGSQCLMPEDFHVDNAFRFEGDTDPGDENVVYAISSVNNDMKGILVNAYGAYSDAMSENMIKKFTIH